MKINKRTAFLNRYGLTLRGEVHEAVDSLGTIIFLHGFPGTSQYIVSQRMIEFSLERFNVFRFDFSGSGDSDGEFYDKLITKEVEDAHTAVTFIKELYPGPIHLVGHSTGAIVASLYSEKPSTVSTVTLLGAVSDMKECIKYDFSEEQIYHFETKGFTTYDRPNHWTYGKSLSRAYYDEFFMIEILEALKKCKIPILIAHGDKDESVPFETNPYELYEVANYPKWFVRISGADHKFTEEHHWINLKKAMTRFFMNPQNNPLVE